MDFPYDSQTILQMYQTFSKKCQKNDEHVKKKVPNNFQNMFKPHREMARNQFLNSYKI